MTTVLPANSTDRPAVAMAVTVASCGSSPSCRRLPVPGDDEQRVVHADAQADQGRHDRAERGRRQQVAEQPDDGEPGADAEQRGHHRQAHRQQRAEADQQHDHRGEQRRSPRSARRTGVSAASTGAAAERERDAVAAGAARGVDELGGRGGRESWILSRLHGAKAVRRSGEIWPGAWYGEPATARSGSAATRASIAWTRGCTAASRTPASARIARVSESPRCCGKCWFMIGPGPGRTRCAPPVKSLSAAAAYRKPTNMTTSGADDPQSEDQAPSPVAEAGQGGQATGARVSCWLIGFSPQALG